MFSNILDRLEKTIKFICKLSIWIAVLSVIAILVITVADILGTKLFKRPLPLTIDFVGYVLLFAGSFALADTQLGHGFIEVSFVVSKLSKRLQAIFGIINSFIGLVIFSILSWKSYEHMIEVKHSEAMTLSFDIPAYVFVPILTFGAISISLVFLLQLGQSMLLALERKKS